MPVMESTTDRDAERLKELIETVKRKLDEIVQQAELIIANTRCNGDHHAV